MQLYMLDSALKILIQSSLDRRKYCHEAFPADKHFLNDWCTIRMSTARGAGHTNAIALVAKSFSRPMIIAPTKEMLKIARLAAGSYDGISFFSVEQISRGISRGANCDSMFVDCSFFLSSRQKEMVEEHALTYLPMNKDKFCLVYV